MDASDTARLVHAQYARLPKTGKPQPGEWTIIAGVVLATAAAPPRVVALGTGTKCLTATQIAHDATGESLHDAHAEVCARRALRAFLLSELSAVAQSSTSDVLQPIAAAGGFELKPDVRFIFYTSEPPCGDAAIFVDEGDDAIAERSAKRPRPSNADGDDSPPPPQQHRTGARPAAAAAMEAEAQSGGVVCTPGLVRTKPGRGVRTTCMSCSDKLARWHALGIQGALLSTLLPAPIRLTTIVVGQPSSLAALRRAVCRGQCAGGDTASSTAPLPPQLQSTSLRFEHALPAGATDATHRPCSNSLVWAACGLSEALNGLSGKRLGANKRQPSPKHRSHVCKAVVLEAWHELVALLPSPLVPAPLASLISDDALRTRSYKQIKGLAIPYQQRKATLLGPPGPLADWLRAPNACEAFVLCRPCASTSLASSTGSIACEESANRTPL